MKELIKVLNDMEKDLNSDIEKAIVFYGDNTDDAEMYIGQLKENNAKTIEVLLEQEDPEDSVYWNGRMWASRTSEVVGCWWNDKDIEVVKIDGRPVALNGWSGEVYTDCFEVADLQNGVYFEKVADNLEVIPEYMEVDGNFETVGYRFY